MLIISFIEYYFYVTNCIILPFTVNNNQFLFKSFFWYCFAQFSTLLLASSLVNFITLLVILHKFKERVVKQHCAKYSLFVANFSVTCQRSITWLISISDLSVSLLENHAFLLILLYANLFFISIDSSLFFQPEPYSIYYYPLGGNGLFPKESLSLILPSLP